MQKLEEYFKKNPNYYFAKYKNGAAYYMISCENWVNNSFIVSIWHILSGEVYEADKSKIEIIRGFNAISENYKNDALALNPIIRAKYKKDEQKSDNSIMTKQQVSQLTEALRNGLLNLGHAKTAIRTAHEQIKCSEEQFNKMLPLVETNKPQVVDYSGSAATYNSLKLVQNNPYTNRAEEITRGSEIIIPNQQKQNTMSGLLSKIPGLNLSFGKLEAGLVALDFNGNLAFRDRKTGGYISLQTDEAGNKKQVHTGDLKFDVPFFTIPSKDLEVGDLVLIDNDLLVVEEKPKTGGFKFVNPITGNTSSKIERTNILNMFFYTKVVSLFSMGQNGEASGVGLGGIDPMMLMMMSQSGGSDSMVEMLVMSQLFGGGNSPFGGTAAGGINPMMLMLMNNNDGGGSGMSDMLPLLLMSQNGGGLFGQQAKPAAKKAARVKTVAKVPAKKTVKKG